MTVKGKSNPIDFAQGINESLTANINHALRTPLNGVVGMMDLLTKTGLSKAQMKYAQIIRESTENLMLQLDNILELAKIEEGELVVNTADCRLEDVIKKALQPFIAVASKRNIPVSVEYGFDLPAFIRTDQRKLQLILTNLFSCALKFVERGKIVLKITKEQLGDDDNPDWKLRFTLENSKILYDALHGSMEQYQAFPEADLREFGEITVSLITTQQLLNALGASISFDHLKEGREPPFHFDLALVEGKDNGDNTLFSVLKGKRALIVQDDILSQNNVTHSLRLWDVDLRIIDDADQIDSEIKAAHKEGRDFDFSCVLAGAETVDFKALDKKLPHMVFVSDAKPEGNDIPSLLIDPVYPEELLSTLASFYMESDPRHEASLAEEASNLLDSDEYDKIQASILLVEDDTTSRLYASELLEELGCQVAEAENGRQAVMRVTKNQNYDLILMDCMMPVMDGYKATQEIREAGFKDTPIIALTANTMEQDKEKCLASGMDDYITKPVREQELYAMLKRHLRAAKNR
tara:strand:- start:2381 stop:3946 length:1566 start_codon:yes stop_codon:yes gene_type:complete